MPDGQSGSAGALAEMPSEGLSLTVPGLLTEPQVLETNGTLETIMSAQPQTPTSRDLSPYDCPWPPTCLGQFFLETVASGRHYPATTTLRFINMHTELPLESK